MAFVARCKQADAKLGNWSNPKRTNASSKMAFVPMNQKMATMTTMRSTSIVKNAQREKALVWKTRVKDIRRTFWTSESRRADAPSVAEASSSSKDKKSGSGAPKAKAGFFKTTGKAMLFAVCVGGVIYLVYAYNDQDPGAPPPDPNQPRKKVVILGSGWGAVSTLREIDQRYYDVTVISPRNYFLFTPLLPSVTVGTVDARSITDAIRHMNSPNAGFNYIEAKCVGVDPQTNTITCSAHHGSVEGGDAEFKIPYDYLIVGVGAINNTFGTPGVTEHCSFLKEIEDAVTIRRKIMDCFEAASVPSLSDEEVKRLLNFVVVGGGPNGVEFAAELRDFVDENLSKSFPKLVPHVNITLLELLDHILSTYDAKISEYTEKHFKKTHIDVKTRYQVVSVGDRAVVTKKVDTNEIVNIPFGLCVWSTGIGPSPLVEVIRTQLPEYQTNRRAILTDDTLKVKGTNNMWAVGDCSTIEQSRLVSKIGELFNEADRDKKGSISMKDFEYFLQKYSAKYPQIELYGKKMNELFEEADINKDNVLSQDEFKAILTKVDSKLKMLPATAQVASQQGQYLGRAFNAQARGDQVKPFRYKHFGSFAYIGDEQAVADFQFPSKIVYSGFGAWWLWRSVYWSKQVSWRNRILVAADWTKTLIFGRDITRN